MNKIVKKVFIFTASIIIFCSICCIVDTKNISKDKAPIFCYNASGGSSIFYLCPGYAITGALDDSNGIKDAQTSSWFRVVLDNIL